MKTHLALLLLLSSVSLAQPPVPKPPTVPTLAELNKRAVDILRDMHDLGRELYNGGDAAGTLRVYQTALRTVSPFIAHHPVIQKAIADGLMEADKLDSDKTKAFKLHEVIEQVRADLRTEGKKLETESKPKDPVLSKTPDPVPPKPKDPVSPQPPAPFLAGTVTLKGKPLAGVDVTIVSLNLNVPRVFTATTGESGGYVFPVVPASDYVLMVTGTGVPGKYQTTNTSTLRAQVKSSGTRVDLALE